MKAGAESRLVAARVVGRVMRGGAYSIPTVRAESADLDERDSRLVQALAFGVLRRLERIDRVLAAFSDRGLSRIQDEVLDLLRVGVFELYFSRVPSPVVVDTVVAAIHQVKPRATGFANAVLRRAAGRQEPHTSDQGGRALELACPPWLWGKMVTAWGEAEAEDFFVASLEDAPVYVRASSGNEPPSAEPVAGIPGAYRVVAASVGELPVQDPSSVAVGLAVEAMPGARVVDLAAAPGGKTLHLLDQVGPEGTVVAVDVHQRRLLSARRRASQAHWVLADSRLPPLQEESFDRVLLDAPCSGLGTLRRRPEIRHRVTEEEVVRLARLQSELIAAALPLVGPGGKLVYSVCTVTPEETVEVVAAYNARPPEGLPGRVWGKGWLLGPHITGTDGMFVSELSRGHIGR